MLNSISNWGNIYHPCIMSNKDACVFLTQIVSLVRSRFRTRVARSASRTFNGSTRSQLTPGDLGSIHQGTNAVIIYRNVIENYCILKLIQFQSFSQVHTNSIFNVITPPHRRTKLKFIFCMTMTVSNIKYKQTKLI